MAPSERELTDDYERHYRLGTADVRRRVERTVLGSDYGASSYTTLAQSGEIAGLLSLGPGVALLDIGTGSGWPGLHLATTTGCRVVAIDQPFEGLRVARQRADEDGLAGTASIVAASGGLLPFRDTSFDAITHADVLC